MDPELERYRPLAEPPRRRARWAKRIAALAVLVALYFAATRISLPMYYAYLPGPVRGVEQMVEVEGAETYSSEGELYMVTVSVDTEVSLVDFIMTLIDPNSVVIDKDSLIPRGTSLDQLEREQEAEMDESKQHAIEVAFAALGLGEPHADGVRIVRPADGSPSDGKLRKDDVILSVGGNSVETTCDVGRFVDQNEPGDVVEVQVRRDGEKVTVQIETVQNPQDPDLPFLGIFMEDINYTFDPEAEVTIDTGEVAGPSAGLMFSLAIYDLLTPEDLTGGRNIAGTGTIACDGGIGPIGGVQQKVAGAEKEGAEVFLAPAANYEAALDAADEIEVVRVSNFADALEYLEGTR